MTDETDENRKFFWDVFGYITQKFDHLLISNPACITIWRERKYSFEDDIRPAVDHVVKLGITPASFKYFDKIIENNQIIRSGPRTTNLQYFNDKTDRHRKKVSKAAIESIQLTPAQRAHNIAFKRKCGFWIADIDLQFLQDFEAQNGPLSASK